MQKGDLVILQQDSSEAYATGWCFGENDRTSKKGDFPAECVYLLPTMSKPPVEILVSYIISLISNFLIRMKLISNFLIFKTAIICFAIN